MLAANSAIASSSIFRRGWCGFGEMRSSGISPLALLSGGPASAGLSPSNVVGSVSDTTSASTGRSEIDSKLLSPLPRRDFGLAMADIGDARFPLAGVGRLPAD